MTRATWITVASLAVTFSNSATGAVLQYSFRDLGPVDPDLPAINNHGQVSFRRDIRATIWTDGISTIINYGIVDPQRATGAISINDQGDVAGYREINQPCANINGIPINFSELGTIGRGRAVAINNSGTVAINGVGDRSYSYSNGIITELTGSSRVQAAGISNDGTIVGTRLSPASTSFRAFRWSGGSFTDVTPSSAGANATSFAAAVNDAGSVVGDYNLPLLGGIYTQPFVLSGGQYSLLDRPTGSELNRPLDINLDNTVVGFVRLETGGFRAVLWDESGVTLLTQYINQPGWILQQATGINDSGQIVGLGTANGQTRAFLLTPIPTPTLGLPLFAIGVLMRRRRLACV